MTREHGVAIQGHAVSRVSEPKRHQPGGKRSKAARGSPRSSLRSGRRGDLRRAAIALGNVVREYLVAEDAPNVPAPPPLPPHMERPVSYSDTRHLKARLAAVLRGRAVCWRTVFNCVLADIQTGRSGLWPKRHVAESERCWREGIVLGEEWWEDNKRLQQQKAEQEAKVVRLAQLAEELLGIEKKVATRVSGMAGTEARRIRAKNLALQMLDSLKLTASEELELDTHAWLCALMDSVAEPRGAELDIIRPRTEAEFVATRDHYNATMNNRRVVICNTGSLVSRILSRRSLGSQLGEARRAYVGTVGIIRNPSACDSMMEVASVASVYGGVGLCALGALKCVSASVGSLREVTADVVEQVTGVAAPAQEGISTISKMVGEVLGRCGRVGTIGLGLGLIGLGFYGGFSAKYTGLCWRDIKSGD